MPTGEPSEGLTARELEVLAQLAEGYSNRAIAERLVVSEGTVHTHVSHVLDKLGVHDRRHAGRIYRALTTLPAEAEEILADPAANPPTSLDAVIHELLDRLAVADIDDARRLYRAIITRSG